MTRKCKFMYVNVNDVCLTLLTRWPINTQPKMLKLDRWRYASACYNKPISECVYVCTACDGLLNVDVASCQKTCCNSIVKTCYPLRLVASCFNKL